MHKRWLFAVVGLLGIVAFGLINRPDGMEFLRDLSTQERIEHDFRPLHTKTGWTRTFTFKETTPELLHRLGVRPQQEGWRVTMMPAVKLANGREGVYNPYEHKLILWDEPGPSWLTSQWDALMTRLSGHPSKRSVNC